MIVGTLELTLTFYATSLKDKRSVVKRVIGRAQSKFNVSGAEVDMQDQLDGAVVGFASVGSDAKYLAGQMQALERFVEELEIAEIVEAHVEIVRP